MTTSKPSHFYSFLAGFLLVVCGAIFTDAIKVQADEPTCAVHWNESVGDPESSIIEPEDCRDPFDDTEKYDELKQRQENKDEKDAHVHDQEDQDKQIRQSSTAFVPLLDFPLENVEKYRASNVLFLPGIQASRLFAAEDISTGLFSGYSAGDRVWEPGRNRDVQMLEMSNAGTPLYSLYSNQILDTITFDRIWGVKFQTTDIYLGIRNFFTQLREEDTVAEWYAYPYDWRYAVSDVAKQGNVLNAPGHRQSLIDTLRALALTSHTGQVTIVAHSNGGLLAKALIDELEAAGDADLVDTLVMIGVPQTGSPKAIGTILHGYDQRKLGGLIVQASLARELLNNFPAVYSLLPSAQYFADTDNPLVTFDDSRQTEKYRAVYGTRIDTYAEMRDFLLGVETKSGRELSDPLHIPARANTTLLDSAWSEKERLSTWSAPAHMRVVEMVGVGLPTPTRLHYADVFGAVCDPLPRATVCAIAGEPRPFFQYSLLGDETVPGVSAGAYRESKELYYINLKAVSDSEGRQDFTHANITEVPGLPVMLRNILQERTITSLPEHFSVDLFNFTNTFTVKRVASPVNILVTDSEGNETGIVKTEEGEVIKMEIPSSRYYELGGVKHVLIPTDIEHTTTLYGTATGTFTYFSDTISTHDTNRDYALYQASTTPRMVATYASDGLGRAPIEIDFTGDGVLDAVYEWGEEDIQLLEQTSKETVEEPPSSRPVVRRQGNSVSQPTPKVAGAAVTELTAEQRSQLFNALVQLQLIIKQLSEDYGNKR